MRLPLHLPRIEVVIEPEECGTPGCARVRIGEEVTEALDVVPAILRVIRTVRPKYACAACATGILQAPAPERAVAKRAWSVVHDPNSPAYRLDEDLGEALCPMPPPEDAAEQAARAIIGLPTFFQDERHRSRRRSR